MKKHIILILIATKLFSANPANNMKLVFSDDFDGPSLDNSKWSTIGDSSAIEFVNVTKVKAIRLKLINKSDMIQDNGISTIGKFQQVGGYFEASIRMNANSGHTGLMSVRSKDGKIIPNINLLWESAGNDHLVMWAQYLDDVGQHDFRSDASGKKVLKPGEPSKKFNTYGLLWTDKTYVWFINGKQVHKVERKPTVAPMYIQFKHRIQEWERSKLNLKELPDDIEIDWVKIWK